MARIVRTPQARADLKQIGRYIASESGSRSIATRFLRRIESKCEQYSRQPLMGDIRDDLAEGVRCFPIRSYVAFYRPLEDGIELLALIHGSRDIPDVFRQRFS